MTKAKLIHKLNFVTDNKKLVLGRRSSTGLILPLTCEEKSLCIRHKLRFVQNIPENQIELVFFHYCTISEYLTGFEIHQLSMASKSIRDDLEEQKVWEHVLRRDYSNSSFYHSEPAKQVVLKMEYGEYCVNCEYEKNQCCTYDLSKADAVALFKLSSKELDRLPREETLSVRFGSLKYQYDAPTVRKAAMLKYKGYMNFENLQDQTLKRKLVEDQRKAEFREWLNTATESPVLPEDRAELLDAELAIYTFSTNEDGSIYLSPGGTPLTRREDSKLASKFISGYLGNMDVKNVAAILAMTAILFSHSYIAFSVHHEECKRRLIMAMFKNRHNRGYTWVNAVAAVHRFMKPKLQRYSRA